MAIVAINKANPDNPSRAASSRVEPTLKDLLGLARAAMHLPSWHDRAKRQTQGAYLSALRGRGMEYDESRPYQAGDDIRTLDWRVTARSGKPHTKLFREERERPVFVLCDMGKTMRFATQGVFKSVLAARAAALIAWKAQQSGDRIGGIVFDDSTHLELAPGRGKPAVARILKALVTHGSHDTYTSRLRAGRNVTDGSKHYYVNDALKRLERLVKPGSLIFVISDFRRLNLSNQNNHTAGVSEFATIARHNDVFALSVTDPLEMAVPKLSGRCHVTDGHEKLSVYLGADKSTLAYEQNYQQRHEKLAEFCRSNMIRLENIMTSDDPLLAIERLLR